MKEKKSDYLQNNGGNQFGISQRYKNAFQRAKVIKLSMTNALSIPYLKNVGKITEKELSHIKELIDKMPVACVVQDSDFQIIYLNPLSEQIFGYSTQEVIGKKSFGIINPEYLRAYFNDLMQELQKGNMASNGRAEFIRKDGETIICEWNEVPVYDEEGRFEGIISMYQDVTERLRNQWLLDGQNKILSMVASGSSLSEILNELVLLIEQMSPRVQGSILLLEPDGKTLRTGAGPTLPGEYNKIVDHLKVEEFNGTCGTAVSRGKMVITSDISNDKSWGKYKDIAKHFNLEACTSIPIFGAGNKILGTFAFYYNEKTTPSDFEFKLIETFSAIAGIAIEKKKTEKELKDKEEQYRTITENINDLIFICDGSGKVVFANSSSLTALEINLSPPIERHILDFIHFEDRHIVKELLEKGNAGTEAKNIFRTVNLHGTIRWIEGTAKSYHNHNGALVLLIGHDITEQKVSEDALRRSEKQLQEAEAIANIGSYEWNFKTKKQYWSAQVYRIFGYEPFELEPTFDWFLKQIHPDDTGWVQQAIQKAIAENQKLDIVYRIIKPDGTIGYIESISKIIYDQGGEAIKLIGIALEVTQRKKTEEALLLSESKFRTAFEFANIGFALMDMDRKFINTNKVLSHILGYSEEEFQKLDIKNLVYEERWEEFNKNLSLIENGQVYSYLKEIRLKHKKEHYIWVYITITLLRDDQDNPLHFIIVVQDISDKKVAEENQLLLTQNLIDQNKSLQQFSYITSHNLRAPITNILGLVELFNLNPSEPEKENIVKNLKKVAENLDNVIKDLNDIISYQKGTSETRQKIVFEDVISTVKKSLEKQLEEANTFMITDFSKAPVIYSIPSYTLSVITNLIENAVKYKSGRRRLIIKINSSVTENFICLRICDNGLGINLDMQKEKVFGMYKRFHRHVAGKGIGLHLVKTQMESMGGRVEIHSKPNAGTCFSLFFRK